MKKYLIMLIMMIVIINIHAELKIPNIIYNTYFFNDTSTGFLFKNDKILTIFGIEVYDKNYFCIDTIFGNQTIGLSFSKKFTSIFEIKSGLSLFYDLDIDEYKIGINFLYTKF